MTVDGCKNWKMINCECSGQWTCAEVNCSLILQTSSWFLASPIATLHSSPVAAWSPSWPSDLQTSKLIVTSYFCVGYMFWWPPATGATSLHPSPRLLSFAPESSESSWLSSESPEFPIYNSSWISASCSGPSVSLSSSMGWSVLTSLWTWVLAQILPSEGEKKNWRKLYVSTGFISDKYFWTILQPSAWWLAHCPFWLWHVGFKSFRFTYLLELRTICIYDIIDQMIFLRLISNCFYPMQCHFCICNPWGAGEVASLASAAATAGPLTAHHPPTDTGTPPPPEYGQW